MPSKGGQTEKPSKGGPPEHTRGDIASRAAPHHVQSRETIMTVAEKYARHALRAARKAVRGGDIALAERWMPMAARMTRYGETVWAIEGERLAIRREHHRRMYGERNPP